MNMNLTVSIAAIKISTIMPLTSFKSTFGDCRNDASKDLSVQLSCFS